MSPYLGPLDKDLVKVILKLLRSPSFLGTAQLLAAIASTDAEQKAPMGLLKVNRCNTLCLQHACDGFCIADHKCQQEGSCPCTTPS
jgi:hypothetical protein